MYRTAKHVNFSWNFWNLNRTHFHNCENYTFVDTNAYFISAFIWKTVFFILLVTFSLIPKMGPDKS